MATYPNPPISWVHTWLKPLWDWLVGLVAIVNQGTTGNLIEEVDAVITAALPASTYANGALGVGATLTANANGAFATYDGVAPVVGQVYLVTAQVADLQNGPYVLTQVGDGTHKAILTRLGSFDQSAEMKKGTFFGVRSGTVNGGDTWKYTGADAPVVGTDSLTFARDPGVMTTNTAQTVTGAKTFQSDDLLVQNVAATFSSKFESAATAARTFTLPDADATAAQAAVASGSTTPGAGGGTAPAFTGTAPSTATANPISGTGLTAAGQVLTTTDNQTVTLNQYAGCWLQPATHPPCYIVSHPATTGAAVAFTVLGQAVTDAGVYKVLAAPTPAGAVASHTHTGAAHTHTQT